MMKIETKMKALERPHISSEMGIFPDAQGQATPQSMIKSDQISNSFETLWLSSLPVRMKKI